MKRGRIKQKIKRFFRPVSILVVPHNSISSFRISVSAITLLVVVFVWSVFTLWTGYVAGRHFDYYVTKADNHYLKAKFRFMEMKLDKGLDYLAMVEKTDNQFRKMLGMENPSSKTSLGGADLSQIKDFKKALTEEHHERLPDMDESIANLRRKSAERIRSFSEISWYITNKYNFAKAMPVSWPVKGRITSHFGYRLSPVTKFRELHSGIDIANTPGTKVRATADGVVRRAGWVSGYGLAVLMDHGFGYSTLYAHNSEILVKENQRIKRGQVIAKMGSTGTSTGPHVHYEVWQNEVPQNPISYIKMTNPEHANISIFESIFSHKTR